MKIISKKEFNRFYTIMKNNPGKSVMELHRLYEKDLMMEANNLADLEELHAKTYKPRPQWWIDKVTNK